VSGGVEDGTAYLILKRPELLRGAAGPKPSGGNSAAEEVGMVGSPAGQDCGPLVGMRPVMRTWPPGWTSRPPPPPRRSPRAIAHRHTNRWPFTRSVMPADALERLVDAARQEGARLTVASAVTRNAIIGLSQAADRRLRARGGHRAELARWTLPDRHRRDGIPPVAVGRWDALETMPVRDFGLLQPHLDRAREQFEPYPTIAVLATEGDTRDRWVGAGQALQPVLLTATWLNLASTPISQPVEAPALRELLTDTAAGVWAQMVLRLGYGRPVPATARRPLTEVLLR
jgi:Nitroreductase family